MAIQFPNFLHVPVTPRDYSGMGDAVSNFYAGYNMPNDALIKEIQAKFAQPNAEADLEGVKLRNAHQSIINEFAPESQRQSILSSKLSNRKAQMDIDRALVELEQQRELERQLRIALSGGGAAFAPASIPIPAPVNAAPMQPVPRQQAPLLNLAPPQTATLGRMNEPAPVVSPAPTAPVQQQASPVAAPPIAPTVLPAGVPVAPVAPASVSGAKLPTPETAPQEPPAIVITKGSPQLAGVDAMYEASPISRAFLEKKGYKKTQEVKVDSKTGKTTVVTKYPSGKITMQSLNNMQPVDKDNIPLTTKSMNAAVAQVRATDAIMPYIDELIRMGEAGELPATKWLPTDANAQYHRVANEALDKYLLATGLNATDKSIDTIKEILFRAFGESTDSYIKGLKKAKANKIRERKLNVDTINQGLKKNVNFEQGDSDKSYSSNEWEEI